MADELTGRALDAKVDSLVMGEPERSMLDVPEYSASWAGAGLVVEEMRRRGWHGVVTLPNENGPGWGAEFWQGDAMGLHGEADDGSAPVAVCRAALRALLALAAAARTEDADG